MGFLRQHERLRVPKSWQGESRAFVSQLERILDTLFNRKVEGGDLSEGLQKRITDDESEISTLKEDVDNIEDEVAKIPNLMGKAATLLGSGDDCNDCIEAGLYYITSGVTHAPTTWCGMFVIDSGIGRDFYQIAYNCNGVWIRDYSGNPPLWREWRKIKTYYAPGDTQSSYFTHCYGFCTNDGKRLMLMMPVPQEMLESSVTLTSLKIELRGTAGYVDIFTATNLNTEKLGTSGYTFAARGINGMLRLQIDKTTAFTNVTNNTPVTGYVAGIAFTVPL